MTERTAGPRRDDLRPLSALFRDLTDEISTLIRGEIRLAKAEAGEKAHQIAIGIAAFAAGGVVLFSGFLVLLAAAVLGLARLLPASWSDPWISALIVGIVVELAGVVLLLKGRSEVSAQGLKPDRTVRTLRENEEFLKDQLGRIG